jgi:hypothetical protein
MIQVLTTALRDEFDELLDDVRSRVRIVSPFIGLHTAQRLADQISEKHIDAELITRFSRADFFKGVSSLGGLQLLDAAGTRIMAVRNLHAKLFIFDSATVIIGSSNLTEGGLVHNLEINVIVQDEEAVVQQAERCYESVARSISDLYRVTSEKIQQEMAFQNSLNLSGRGYERTFDRSRDFGEQFTPDQLKDEIETVLEMSSHDEEESDTWLKFEGLVENRLGGAERVTRIRKGGVYITNFPRRPRGVSDKDTIILAVLSYNKEGRPMPMIVGYGNTDGYDSRNEHSADEIRANPLLDRFSFFLRVFDLKIVDAPVEECIPMTELYSSLGNGAFPTTKARPVQIEQLHQLHFRRDKMRLTTEAKQYLVDRLERLFAATGTI